MPAQNSQPKPHNQKNPWDAWVAKDRVTIDDFIRHRRCGFNLVRLGEGCWDINDSVLQIPSDCRMGINVTTKDCILFNSKECIHSVKKHMDTPCVDMFDFGDEKSMDEMKLIELPYNMASGEAVNSEVHALESIFLHSDVSSVHHTGDALPKGTMGLPDNFGPILKLESGTAGVSVSFFTAMGRRYVMLVNHDINNKQEVRMSWKRGVVPFIATDEVKAIDLYSDLAADPLVN